MGNRTVMDALARYSPTDIGHRAELFFTERLMELLPNATFLTEKSQISLQPDIIIQDGERSLFFEVKASTERGVIPPSGYSAVIQQLDRYRYRFHPGRDSWTLLTTYEIPDSMVDRFGQNNLGVFHFNLEDEAETVVRRLRNHVQSVRGGQEGGLGL